ncbi:MAG: acyl-CoA thioesterase [Crocinitomicaceae bacterium]|jgi:acyl-CoA thioesterase YciA|nr:acyl-CoA thioesterase [Crocinitomicaceae bacterium]MBT5403953.1 acyl-CoA thioesterase [Crocinitomicaceae bacterium]MBT6030223.1 acyl-CoA thioesterase [Crocinitomicaceae bacterium]MBT6515337.1 acyl-CoA thioesterase [Crocinitomicaceae bacterium]MDG2331532.1 acyl-CoA thioesterase [Flavobacteriales bacterium]
MERPKGKLALQVVAMPADTNPAGDIFGGWLLSQMDIAGGIFCRSIAKGRVVTVSIESTEFKIPVFVGDTLSCFVELKRKGRSSLSVNIEAWVTRDFVEDNMMKATEGTYTFVKVNADRIPVPIS